MTRVLWIISKSRGGYRILAFAQRLEQKVSSICMERMSRREKNGTRVKKVGFRVEGKNGTKQRVFVALIKRRTGIIGRFTGGSARRIRQWR